MSRKNTVPDAWDDDWVNQADLPPAVPTQPVESKEKISKAERRARQAELNRKLWEEAETPNTPYFVDARNDIPLRSDLKPSIKLLSRKPAPTVVSRKDPVSGIEKLTLEADDDDDEDEEGKVQPLSAEERLLKAQREREEKQRKYEEARERLFGSPSPASGVSSPRNGTSPPSRSGERGRGRSRGHVSKESSRDMRDIGEDQSGPSTSGKTRQLYDPNYDAKPDSMSVQRKEQQSMDSGSSTPVEEAAIRSSRGPDGNGRGGIGFTRRGGKGI